MKKFFSYLEKCGIDSDTSYTVEENINKKIDELQDSDVDIKAQVMAYISGVLDTLSISGALETSTRSCMLTLEPHVDCLIDNTKEEEEDIEEDIEEVDLDDDDDDDDDDDEEDEE